jgi:hypothetical protein
LWPLFLLREDELTIPYFLQNFQYLGSGVPMGNVQNFNEGLKDFTHQEIALY